MSEKTEQQQSRIVTRSKSRTTSTSSIDSLSSSAKRKANPESPPEYQQSHIKHPKASFSDKATMEEKMDQLLVLFNQWKPTMQMIAPIRDNIDTIATQVKSLDSRLSTLEANQAAATSSSEAALKELRNEIAKINNELNQLKQQNLASDFVLHGLPPQVSDDQALEVLVNFGASLGEVISQIDLKRVKAFPDNNNKTSKLVGTFYQQSRKDKLVEAYKKCKKPVVVEAVLTDIAETSPWRGKEVVLRNLMTPYNRRLLGEARAFNDLLPESQRFKFVWESNGRILLKRTEASRPSFIGSMDDFRDIVANMPNI